VKQAGRNIILFGPPGVGKGAQATILGKRCGIVHLSTGDVIREEIAAGTELGRRVKESVGRGELADDQTVLGIVMARIDRPEFRSGFIMDGFPRTVRQAELFDELLRARDRRVDFALFIVAPEATVLKRLAGRLLCSRCGETYHQEFKRPRIDMVCDRCGEKVGRRHDDAPETHQERLRAYHEKTEPLQSHYRRTGVLVEIDGDRTIDEVAVQIARAIGDKP
jgi:adenylate kinase